MMQEDEIQYTCQRCQKNIPTNFIQIHEYNCFKRNNGISIKKEKIRDNQDYYYIPCTQCGQSYPFQYFGQHLEECDGRSDAKCQYCKFRYPTYLMKQHYQVCQTKIQHERNQTEIRIQRQRNQRHQRIRQLRRQTNPNSSPNSGMANLLTMLIGNQNEESQNHEGENSQHLNLLMLALLLRARGNQQQGIKKQDIKKLKTKHGQSGDGNCAVCYCQIQDAEKIYHLGCQHKFHVPCLQPWLEKNSKCPLCRKNVLQGTQKIEQ